MDSTQILQVSHHNIALLPPPGFLGHLIPFIELAKKLVFHHNCTVTLIISDYGSPIKLQTSLLRGIPATISPIFLPPVPTADLSENLNAEILLQTRLIRSLPSLRDALSRTPASALVVDLFAPYAIDVARELGIPAYVFYVVASNELSLTMNLPELKKSFTFGNVENPELVYLPGSLLLNREDFPDSLTDSEVNKWTIDLREKYLSAEGILVNTFQELESAAFEHLELLRPGIPPVYPVGPSIRTGLETETDREPECLKWLDDQPPKSVVFVSFGSGGSLTVDQIRELALGLELSGHRFLWVVRSPQENAAAAYLKGIDQRNPLECLPEGFLERTEGRGLAVALWAPQIRVLSHDSTGEFLTHCGWNSILESAVYGMPLIAWPLCFEQKLNATVLTDGLKGAMRVRENENGIVERENISNVVKQLMEGEEGKQIRKRMIQLKIAAGNALSRDGSSTLALAQVVHNWTTRTK
ncbi:hypothetical protein C2S51_020752 [Perilla frutescens var. frutescens]|nr:hypothetical protein C2S51_020752 [Perilla frutescens var. frutescens]